MTVPLSRERLKRIHALCGVLPLGVFVVAHLFGNAYALWGRARFESHLVWVDALPGRAVVEVAFVLLPLLVHAGIGVRLMLDPVAAAQPGTAARDWPLALQRATGLLALVFIAVHLGQYRWPRAMGELHVLDVYDRLSIDMQGMGQMAFYLAGTSAVVFHLTHGLVRFLSPADRPVAPPRRRRVVVACGAAGVLLWLVSLEILGHYYAGGSVAGSLGLLRALGPGGAVEAP